MEKANKGTVLLFPSPCLYFRNERTVPMFISKQKDRPRAYPRAYPCLFLLITSTMIILYISIFPIEFMFCSAILQNPIDWNMSTSFEETRPFFTNDPRWDKAAIFKNPL